MTELVVGLLAVSVLLAICYVIVLRRQTHAIQKQLTRSIEDETFQPLTVELLDADLNELTASINDLLALSKNSIADENKNERIIKDSIAGISHDIRTPLTVIKGNIQRFKKSDMDENQLASISAIEKHTQSLESLADQFFEYSIQLLDEARMVPEKVCLSRVASECLATFVTSFEQKGINVSFHEEELHYVEAQHDSVERIINNLLRNCVVHSAGDVSIEVLAPRADAVEFLVRNPVSNAIQLDINRVFDRFYSSDLSRGKFSGLGLHIVLLLAEKNGGTAKAKIDGSCFEVRVEFKKWVDGEVRF